MPERCLVLKPVAIQLTSGVWNGWSWAIVDGETVLAHSGGYFRSELAARFNAESVLRRLGLRESEEPRDA